MAPINTQMHRCDRIHLLEVLWFEISLITEYLTAFKMLNIRSFPTYKKTKTRCKPTVGFSVWGMPRTFDNLALSLNHSAKHPQWNMLRDARARTSTATMIMWNIRTKKKPFDLIKFYWNVPIFRFRYL